MPFILSVLQNFIIDKHKKATNFSENIFFEEKFFFGRETCSLSSLYSMNVEYQPFNSSSKSDLTSSETSPSSSAFSSNGYNSSSLEKIRGVDISQKRARISLQNQTNHHSFPCILKSHKLKFCFGLIHWIFLYPYWWWYSSWTPLLADFEQKMTKNALFLPYKARKWIWGIHLLFDLP